MSLAINTLVGSTTADLEERAGRLMASRGETGDPAAYVAGLGSDRLVGTPDQILEQLKVFAEVGIDRVMMQHLLHQDLEAVAVIGQEIIPEAAGQ